MHGYAAFEPVLSQVRPAQHAINAAPPPESPRDADGEAVVVVGELTPNQPASARLRDAWADVREAWRQTTFFVLDPNSWG